MKSIYKIRFRKIIVINKYVNVQLIYQLDKFINVIVNKKNEKFAKIQNVVNEINMFEILEFVFFNEFFSNDFDRFDVFHENNKIQIETHANENTNFAIFFVLNFDFFVDQLKILIVFQIFDQIHDFKTIVHLTFSIKIFIDVAKQKNLIEFFHD